MNYVFFILFFIIIVVALTKQTFAQTYYNSYELIILQTQTYYIYSILVAPLSFALKYPLTSVKKKTKKN